MRRYALIGRNIGYSLSPEIHNRAFREMGIDAVYELRDMKDLSGFREVMRELDGANVTIPYKQEVMPLLDRLTKDAEDIGAVNTIYKYKGELIGANTDWRGFLALYMHATPCRDAACHVSSLILGTGGASKAVVYAMKSIGIEARTVTHKEMSLGAVDVSAYNLIINATPSELPNIDYDSLIPKRTVLNQCSCFVETGHAPSSHDIRCVIDLRYSPEVTPFMKEAEARGARVYNGMRMLEEQARAAREIWFGKN